MLTRTRKKKDNDRSRHNLRNSQTGNSQPVGLSRPASWEQQQAIEKANHSPHSLKTAQLIQRIVPPTSRPRVLQLERLFVQQGPSCWLYVLESVLEAHGENTSSIQHIMRSYPSSDDAVENQRRLQPGRPQITKRGAAVALIAERFNELRTKLLAYRQHAGNNANVSQAIFTKMVQRSNVTPNIINDFNWGPGNSASIGGILGVVNRVHQKATTLAGIVQNDKDDVGSLLQSGAQTVDKEQRKKDVHLTLNQLVQDGRLPVYLHIRKRFKLSQEERRANSVNLTMRDKGDMEETNHAVLMTNYNLNHRTITYKDPNYGNAQIIITLKQFQEMGGDNSIKIRPYLATGRMRSNLANVTG